MRFYLIMYMTVYNLLPKKRKKILVESNNEYENILE